MKGWPPNKGAVPNSLTPYFSYLDELTVQDGVILRDERDVIPVAMRPEIKKFNYTQVTWQLTNVYAELENWYSVLVCGAKFDNT